MDTQVAWKKITEEAPFWKIAAPVSSGQFPRHSRRDFLHVILIKELLILTYKTVVKTISKTRRVLPPDRSEEGKTGFIGLFLLGFKALALQTHRVLGFSIPRCTVYPNTPLYLQIPPVFALSLTLHQELHVPLELRIGFSLDPIIQVSDNKL